MFKKILLVTLITSAGVFFYLKHSASTATEGQLKLSGLHGPVTIFRDKYGVPHINAEASDADAYYALGYAQAQDRFWQMEFQRRVVSGTLSEIFGDKTIDMDKYLRTWGFYKAAQQAWPSLNKQSQAYIESYTAGVNAFIKQGKFPLEIKLLRYQPKQWTVIDSIAWEKMMAWTLQSHSWLNKIKYTTAEKQFGVTSLPKYFPNYPINHSTTLDVTATTALTNLTKQMTEVAHAIGFNDADGKGSNGWVVDGAHSVTGKPILANDVHLALTAPGLWYLVELKGPTLHVTGATLPGLPGVVIGHNDDIAWGVTSGYNDAADLYVVTDKIPLQKHIETIIVKNSKTIELPVYTSEYGPIISDVTPQLKNSQDKIAVTWTSLQPVDTTPQSFFEIDTAKNWNDFTAALKDFVTPTQNFIYADKDGNIGYYYPGRLPIRHWQDLTFLPATNAYQWQQYIPFNALPHELNPVQGFIATANNKPVADNYPFSLNARWPVPPFRVERIRAMLQDHKVLSMQDMQQIQGDVLSEFWLQIRSYLLATKPNDATSAKALSILNSWNGKMEIDNPAPTIFSYWVNAFSPLYPASLQQADKIIDPIYLKEQLANTVTPSVLSSSLQSAMQQLVKDHGSDTRKWKWGSIHQAVFAANGFGKVPYINHIWNRQIAAPGGAFTVDVGGYDPATFKEIQGPSYRQIIDMSNLDESLFIAPMGQSGNIFSPHYKDMLSKWRDVKYIKIKPATECKEGDKSCLVLLPM